MRRFERGGNAIDYVSYNAVIVLCARALHVLKAVSREHDVSVCGAKRGELAYRRRHLANPSPPSAAQDDQFIAPAKAGKAGPANGFVHSI